MVELGGPTPLSPDSSVHFHVFLPVIRQFGGGENMCPGGVLDYRLPVTCKCAFPVWKVLVRGNMDMVDQARVARALSDVSVIENSRDTSMSLEFPPNTC